eukprot:scaffold148651_cov31-Tisochrysis_lutea.AAC.1
MRCSVSSRSGSRIVLSSAGVVPGWGVSDRGWTAWYLRSSSVARSVRSCSCCWRSWKWERAAGQLCIRPPTSALSSVRCRSDARSCSDASVPLSWSDMQPQAAPLPSLAPSLTLVLLRLYPQAAPLL